MLDKKTLNRLLILENKIDQILINRDKEVKNLQAAQHKILEAAVASEFNLRIGDDVVFKHDTWGGVAHKILSFYINPDTHNIVAKLQIEPNNSYYPKIEITITHLRKTTAPNFYVVKHWYRGVYLQFSHNGCVQNDVSYKRDATVFDSKDKALEMVKSMVPHGCKGASELFAKQWVIEAAPNDKDSDKLFLERQNFIGFIGFPIPNKNADKG